VKGSEATTNHSSIPEAVIMKKNPLNTVLGGGKIPTVQRQLTQDTIFHNLIIQVVPQMTKSFSFQQIFSNTKPTHEAEKIGASHRAR